MTFGSFLGMKVLGIGIGWWAIIGALTLLMLMPSEDEEEQPQPSKPQRKPAGA